MIKHHRTVGLLALSLFALSIGTASTAFAESAGHYIDDATITAKVKEAILADSQLKVLQVKVDTTHGIVVLTGSVDTSAQETEAVRVTNNVAGVTSVTDNLTIKSVSVQ